MERIECNNVDPSGEGMWMLLLTLSVAGRWIYYIIMN